ncbi:MAG TPA: acriflavine resistance protein B [Lentisphaeria bacterium]|nr:MAG: acriflavine resistance protein B [Lentisphaerae bacterium GWF2_50_93]HCE44217.1 acriflavine resistance protein B [Lentisphaeria bacterium]
MNISAPFIKRPVMTTLLTAAILMFGMLTYPLIPVSDLPNVDYPVIQVSASLPGASPETMASAVATPLEKQFSTIAGLESMSSSSSLGSVQITLQFALEMNIDAAAQDVQSCIARTSRSLPSDMPSPPSYRKVNPADTPIMFIALVSPTLTMSDVDRIAQNMIIPKISMTPGVSQVSIHGTQKYAVRIQIDPKNLAAMGIGIDEVQKAIAAANVNMPGGILDGRTKTFTIQPKGQLMKAEEYNSIIIMKRNGDPVRLSDIGKAFDSVENEKSVAWYCRNDSQQRAIVMAVEKQPGVNTVKVAGDVKALLPDLQAAIPPSVSINLLFDRSMTIKNSASEVKFTMMLTIGLVVLVIFLFLRNIRATFIPSLSLPLSLLGTFSIMYVLGYSFDNLSLMALTLSLGFVVDDAIVALENIFRHYEMGKTPMQAAFDGSGEVAFTIISMTLSLSAVFIPVLFMGGVVGRLFNEFAMTIGTAVLVSGVVALSLIPMLSSRFMSRSIAHDMEKTEDGHGGIWNSIIIFYKRTLTWSVHHTWVTFIISAAVVSAMFWLYTVIPKGFVPNEDQNRIMINTEAEQGVGFESMKERMEVLVRIIQKEVPELDAFMARCGGGRSSYNSGFMMITLKTKKERKRGAEEIIADLRKKLSNTPGIRVFIQNPPPIQIGARGGKAQYQYTLLSPDTDVLYKFAPVAEARMSAMPELIDISSDLQISTPQVDIEIDRDQASKHGISIEQIENVLYSAYGTRQISSIFAPDDQYSVLMEIEPSKRGTPEALSLLHIRSDTGQLVPLDVLVKRILVAGPQSVNHTGQLPSVTISFNLKQGVALGDAVEAIQKNINPLFPSGVSGSFQGVAQAFQKSMKGMNLLFILTIFIIYMVLGILYESFIHPLTILTALPFAGFGALFALWLLKIDLSIYAFIGLIMLVGIVKKNGIMMVDFAIEARRRGMSPEDSIIQASVLRFRPIVMTSLTALMAGIPLAVGTGLGCEARQPLGVTVVGGIIFSQILTLYATPVFYVWMEKLQTFLKSRMSDRNPA